MKHSHKPNKRAAVLLSLAASAFLMFAAPGAGHASAASTTTSTASAKLQPIDSETPPPAFAATPGIRW